MHGILDSRIQDVTMEASRYVLAGKVLGNQWVQTNIFQGPEADTWELSSID